MRTVEEAEVLSLLDETQGPVLLLEPGYTRKYPPLGLAKIATYLRRRRVPYQFARGFTPDDWKLVCITSLFTYDLQAVEEAIATAIRWAPRAPILLGGVCATLIPKRFASEDRLLLFRGYSQVLDQCVPDYRTNWRVEKPWDQFSFTFTSRGCPNRCAYCAVWRLERDAWVNPSWKAHIVKEKPCAMISDNNLSATPLEHVEAVVKTLAARKKKVVFDNGFDCKLVTPEMAQLLARVKYTRTGMRLAFDRIEEDGTFQRAVELLLEAGVSRSQVMAYVLFNFQDTPQEAHYRMRVVRDLGVRPYPTQYTPLNKTTRGRPYIGKHWTPRLVRAFRTYWLMESWFRGCSFEEFVAKRAAEAGRKRAILEDNDWAAWAVQGA